MVLSIFLTSKSSSTLYRNKHLHNSKPLWGLCLEVFAEAQRSCKANASAKPQAAPTAVTMMHRHPKASSGAHARKKVAAKPATVRNSKKLELPVLARDGDNVLLRFTKIFSPAAEEMEKPHPAKIRQPVTGTLLHSTI